MEHWQTIDPEKRILILYEDNHLIAVNKPAGMPAQEDSSGDKPLPEFIKAWLKQTYNKPGNVYLGGIHRLDRPVSGVVLFAKTSKAAARLSSQFREHTVRKEYLAVVEGELKPPSGTFSGFLSKDRSTRTSRISNSPLPGTKTATSEYVTLDSRAGRSLVMVKPLTGRSHQIRSQLAAAGTPIVGDAKYGASSRLPNRRIALLAQSLQCVHPVRQDVLRIEAPTPSWWPWPPPASGA